MKNFGISLLLALTVSVQGTSAFNYQDVQAKKRLIAQHQISNEMQEKRKRSFEIANTLLRRKGVPFDPEVLLQDHWQKTLAPVFAQMPEMQEVRYLDSLRGGVEIADSLYFPEKVPVLDDVIIIARHLVFEGKDVVIKGNHNVSIFPAEKVTIMGDKLPKQVSKKNEKEMVSVRIPNTRPPDKGGSITVDTSGIGYKDWLESIGGEAKLQKVLKSINSRDKRIRGAAEREFELLRRGNGGKKPGISPLDQTRDTSGQPGSIGSPGAMGAQPDAPSPSVQPKAANGVCGGNNSGLKGTDGAWGGDAGAAGTGGTGTNGTAGAGGSYSINDGDSQTWHFISHGGQGGPGGPGGFAWDGAKGGTGGQGGDGADCSCAQGGAGNGGKGGKGGKGGNAGHGGGGGKGGNGKNGGNISVSVPCRNNWSGSYEFDVREGGRGIGGDASSAGSPGQAGDPGGGGSPGTNHNCPSSAGQSLGSGDSGIGGAPADPGDPGMPGDSDGNPGSFTPTERSCGDECGYDQCYCACDPPRICLRGTLCGSPVLIDVQGNGFAMTDGPGGVDFDLAATGHPMHISWTVPNADDGWLALDRNNNGTIDSGQELFGSSTPQPLTSNPNGFDALAIYDKPENGGNNDGQIDSHEAIFSSLLIWQDVNHNGVSEPDELHTLTSIGLASIDLRYKESKRTDQYGNLFRYRAKVKDIHGAQPGRWAYDVFLIR